MKFVSSVKSNAVAGIILAAVFLLGSFYQGVLLAQTNTTPPSFPSCQSLYGTAGNIASYSSGSHQIVGNGIVNGSDNVYSQSSGNYLQCYCPAQGTSGIQTNWWLADGLSQGDISSYTSSGWFHVNGEQWNLGNHMYLAKNSDAVCAQTTPTPTSTPRGLSEPSAPVCNAPAVTKAPLYSKANLSRIDKDSIKVTWIVTDGQAQKYGIHYGTSPTNLSWYTEVSGHDTNEAVINSVPEGAIYFKVCSIGTCGDAICGSDIPTVLGTATQLPATGAYALAIIGLAPLGYYLYKRFRLA
jgi:hypothetical protein